MNYTQLLNELNQANSFDLYRLSVAIRHQLDDPKRIVAIKRQLRIGMTLSYFDATENRLINGLLLEMRHKNVVVLDQESKKRWVLGYYMLNIDSVDVDIYTSKNTDTLTANHLKVGERVGFNKEGEEIVGVIKRLNQKTVTLETSAGKAWRVSYTFLYRVHEGEAGCSQSIKWINQEVK